MSCINLNLSQKEIAMSEVANSHKNAVNTISLKIKLPDIDCEKASKAVDAVLASADVFTLIVDGSLLDRIRVAGAAPVSLCEIADAKTLEEAEVYMSHWDKQTVDTSRELYKAEVIPIKEGGCIVYVIFHHIIIDGYGMSLFAQRVLDVLAGKDIPHSVFLSDTSTAEESDGAQFWQKYFEEAEFEPAIFAEKPTCSEFFAFNKAIDRALANKIKKFAKKENLTPAYVMAAAYGLYLAEATGKKDAVMLMPRLNRTPDQMQTIGCYTLLVPVRVTLSEKESFADFCRRVEVSAREASRNKGYGYDRILKTLRDDNIISESLSEYVFNFYRYEFDTTINHETDYSVAGAMHNHLTYNVFSNSDGGFNIRLDCREGVYNNQRAEFFFDSMCRILNAGTDGAMTRDISIVGEDEYNKNLSVYGVSYDVSCELTIPSMLRENAAKTPDAYALHAGEVSLTFKELDEVSDRIAKALVSRGVKKGDCVAFMLNRDWRIIPTILGISKSGAAFIPVDPAYPQDRVNYIIENSKAAHLISSQNVDNDDKYTYLEIDELIDFSDISVVLPEIKQNDTAYIIYTSGTTGRPKGVMLSHKGIANIVHPDNNPFNRDITKNCRGIVAIGSICFDISLFEIFVPLFSGLFVEFGNEKAMFDASELARHIQKHNADIIHCTPSRIAAYLSNPAFADAIKDVKAILAAGEVLPGSLVEQMQNTYGIRMYNGYGPTETTIGATITEAGDMVSIGKPIGNMGVVLLNNNRKMVPFGATGEICVHGNGVGIGYKDREEETASKYINWNGLRLYRTGDLGHLGEDSRLIYHGRNDRQVKLRGLRIELSEIEKVMSEVSGIALCNCMIKKIDRTEHLVGFYTVAAGASVDVQDMRAFMKSRLTPYMVPDILKELPSMPQTPGGKTDLKALALIPVEYSRVYKKPISHKENAVCSAFETVLKMENVGLDDNFFELGGTSLDAVEVILQIENKLNLENGIIEFGDLYRFPTPALILDKIYGESTVDDGFDLKSLDYSGIDAIIGATSDNATETKHLGNILLTGVTGYLGIHILIDLLKRPDICGKIVCLARPKKKLMAERRVKTNLFYFNEEDFSEGYGDKWIVAEGDITNPDIFTEPCDVHIDTIINSAANVAHFAYGDALTKNNTDGVKNLITFAKNQGATLCQVSTISVGGCTDNSDLNEFTETDFYIGQKIHNSYIYSKYMAEYVMLRAAVDDGLKIKLMRVGNLQGRIADGEFQMNMQTNAFGRTMASYIKLGAVPQSVYNASVNFSPVDETAHNIVSLTALDIENVAFHVYPPKEVEFKALFDSLKELGHNIEILSDADFDALVQKKKQNAEGREQLEGLVTAGIEGNLLEIPITNHITDKCLLQSGNGWSEITSDYLNKYLSALDDLMLF